MGKYNTAIIFCISFFFNFFNDLTATDSWTKIPISGGNIICMKEFPENSQVLLCCTDKGGLFRSSNSGNSWNEILSGKFFDIAVAESGKVFCAGENGLYYSEDYGITFNNILPHFTSQVVYNKDGIVIADTVQYSKSPYLISFNYGVDWKSWVGTESYLLNDFESKRSYFLFPEDGSVLRSIWMKIYKSNGSDWENWNLIHVESYFEGRLIRFFQQDVSTGILYGYSKYYDFHPSLYYGGFWQSADTGKTWDGVIDVNSVTSLERDTNKQENIDVFLIGTADGGIVTFDKNKNITKTIGALGGEVTSIIASGWKNGKLLVSTKGGIYRTSDYGNTWTKSDEGIYQVEVNAAQIIDVDNHERIVAALNNSGIWTSDDDGLSWQSVNKNLFITQGMLKKSPFNPELLIGGGSEIFQSIDGGKNWYTKFQGYFPLYYYGWYSRCSQISFNPQNSNEVFINFFDHSRDDYVGTFFLRGMIKDSSIYFSDPGWIKNTIYNTCRFQIENNTIWSSKHIFNYPNSSSYLVGIEMSSGDTIKIIQTPNFGDCNSYWYVENNLCFLLISQGDNHPYFCVSNDYGNSWEEKDVNFPNHLVQLDWNAENYPGGFIKSSDGKYYLFVSGNGVYSTSDNGETWQTINEGLSSLVVSQLDFSPTNPNVMYLATNDGLYKRNVTSEVEEKDNNVISDFIFNNYPNPFNAETKITFTVAMESNCKLIIFDVLGNEIETLIDKRMPAGKHTFNFNAGKYTSGIYFYSLYVGNQVFTKKMIVLK